MNSSATAVRAVRLVAMRELREGLRSRAFLATFAITLLLILAAVVLPAIFGGDDQVHLGVVGSSTAVTDELEAVAATQELDLRVSEVADVDAGEADLRAGELNALLVGDRELVVEQQANQALQAVVGEATARVAIVESLEDLGASQQAAAEVMAAAAGVDLRTLEEPEDDRAFVFALGGTVLLLMGVTFFASSVLTGVVEEKSSRVVEVVLGAMRPWQLLAGKLLGIGTLALGQVLVLVAVAVIALLVTGSVDLPETTVSTAVAMVGWFVLGFAFYSVVYAAAGSLVSRVEDAQSSAGPIAFLLFAAYLSTFVVVLPDPDGLTSVILSQIPGVAPLTMPARVALGGVTAIEMVSAVLITLVVTAVAVRMAGRVYEWSVLRTDHVRWRDALRRAPATS